MTDLSRRGALKAGGVGGIFALFTGAGVTPRGSGVGALTTAAADHLAPAQMIANPLRGTERALFEALERRRGSRYAVARGELDPDIVALKSVAPQAKAIIQRFRDEQTQTVMDRLRKLVWGG